MDTNTAAGPGHNLAPPMAQEVKARLELDYGELILAADTALAQADDLPITVENSDDVANVSALVVKLRDLIKRAESHRVAEGEPYLRGKEAVDAFFKRLQERIEITRKSLTASVDRYKQAQLAAEKARREAEAAAARKAAAEAARIREEAELAARRARTTKAEKEAEAAAARAESQMADSTAEVATLNTMAKAGAMVGERFEGVERSGQVTMRKTPVVFIEDVSQLDLELLRPFLKLEHLEQALRAWAKATNYAQEMPGATVAMRDATVIR